MIGVSAMLLHYTPIWIVADAARTCTDTIAFSDDNMEDVLGPRDHALIKRICCKHAKRFDPNHDSILEHLNYTFHLDFSRACLQELARHRHASISVQSTRYALHKAIDGEAAHCVYDSGHEDVNDMAALSVSFVSTMKNLKVPNDVAKYAIPEALMTEAIWTINARSLRNFFELRTVPRALDEIQKLAFRIYDEIPEGHKFLFEDFVYNGEE